MSNALAMIPLNDIQVMADAMAGSGLFGMKSPVQAMALMLVAQSEGQHPATIAQDYDVIQGKATRKTHSVLARFQAAGGRVEWHELTEAKADATFAHPAGGALRMVWTFEQAKKAGLTGKDNWKNYPRAMLRARCIAEGVRAVFPAAIGGMMVAEEAMDAPASAPVPAPPSLKHMGAADVVHPPAQPTWPDAAFAQQLPRWQKAVEAGMKSAADIEALATSKGALTAEQLAAIRALKPLDPGPADDDTAAFAADMTAAEGTAQ
jgi:hypothetical protein